MAIDLCSENSGTGTGTGTGNNITMSPRISFSHDLSQSDITLPAQQLLPSTDFNFCIQLNPDHHHASMADELFSDGKIIPAQIKQQPPPPPPVLPPRPPVDNEQQNSSKSFWGFKRSSSCGNGYARSLCPIPLMSRSNSTGSSASGKRKEGYSQKQPSNFQKPPLRKVSYSYGNNGSNGVRVNPVLNLGFGSLFSSARKK